MTDVVAQIKESMELEARRDGKRNSAMDSGDLSYAGNGSAFEVEGSVGKISQASPGPAMRQTQVKSLLQLHTGACVMSLCKLVSNSWLK